jgi:23S rRNA (adenine2503-C2)-methyltransferase
MSSLPRALREKLAEEFSLGTPEVVERRCAADGAEKIGLRLEDGVRCETVLIPLENRLTQCLSSQAGCPLGCAFCHTGQLGLKRNLKAFEMVDQWLTARREGPAGRRVSNLVFMGMGEPLLNYHAVREALEILISGTGGGFSPARITISTAGIVPGIERLGKEFPGVNLAVSLNAPDDTLRNRIMPLNRKYPLARLMAALHRYPLGRRRLTVEYVMLGGVNDSPETARRLAGLLKGLRCKVNLIPFNPHSGLPFSPPLERGMLCFQQILRDAGYPAPIRRSKGAEIAAACGQLGQR